MQTRIKNFQRKMISEITVLEGNGTQEEPYLLVTYWLSDDSKLAVVVRKEACQNLKEKQA